MRIIVGSCSILSQVIYMYVYVGGSYPLRIYKLPGLGNWFCQLIINNTHQQTGVVSTHVNNGDIKINYMNSVII